MEKSHWRPEETRIIEGRAVKFSDVCVHEFTMGDVEDPMLLAGEPIWQWQQSESGQWVMENAVEQPYWTQQMDTLNWGHRFKIMARLSEPNQVFWKLKWGNK